MLPVIEGPHSVELALTLKSAEVKLAMFPWLTGYRRFIIRFAVVVIGMHELACRGSTV